MKKRNAAYWLFLLPSLLGVLVFYVVPFGYSLWYAVTDNIIDQNFVIGLSRVGTRQYLRSVGFFPTGHSP